MDFPAWASALRDLDAPQRRPHRTYREVWSRVAEIACASEGRVAVEPFGASANGEPLWSATVPPNPHPTPAPDPSTRTGTIPTPVLPPGTVLVFANLHAMEHVGVEVAVSLLSRAAAGEAGWPARRLVVVPMVNPDGFLAVERALAAGRRRFYRANARGVDLNRNFGAFWDDRYIWNRLARPLWTAGEGPLSEPETRALDALAARVKPDVVVSLHAFGEWIIIPYAGSRRPPRDLARLQATAEAMAARQPRRYKVMRLGERTRVFEARGAEIDHFYERHGAMSFLFEIGAGPSLFEPAGWLWPYRWYTPEPERLARDVANVLPALDYLAEAPLAGGSAAPADGPLAGG